MVVEGVVDFSLVLIDSTIRLDSVRKQGSAGIMGMMVASGLSEQLSLWFIAISNEFTFPLLTFISAGIVNIFIPSGGGQWAVQGPIMISASLEMGTDTAKTAMAVAWGDS